MVMATLHDNHAITSDEEISKVRTVKSEKVLAPVPDIEIDSSDNTLVNSAGSLPVTELGAVVHTLAVYDHSDVFD